MDFELHPTLAADSHLIIENEHLMLRLIDDSRFPWVIIVPKIPGISELHALPDDVYGETVTLAKRLGTLMKNAFRADRINTAAIGNMVPQLHVHVVARLNSDPAWPKPIWGFGEMVRMDDAEIVRRTNLVLQELGPI